MNTLQNLGFPESYNTFIKENNLDNFSVGRIVNQQKERYLVFTESGIFPAEITGNLRYSAKEKADFPVVGDWVLLIPYDEMVLIHQVLPRNTILKRKSASSQSEEQIIAANIDVALVVQSLDNDFNLNRLDRYITIAVAGKIQPLVVLNKTDLVSEEECNHFVALLRKRHAKILIVKTNTVSRDGCSALQQVIEPGKTYCFIGSSGVGKSTLINALSGNNALKTNAISAATKKGKHTTTHKALFLLPNNGIVIDTPGMREVGIADDENGIQQTFTSIVELAKQCKFPDCRHEQEPGCAVREALEKHDRSEDHSKL